MRMSDWSSDVCSSDLDRQPQQADGGRRIGDFPGFPLGKGLGEGQGENPDILMLVIEAVDAAGGCRIDLRAEHVEAFAAETGCGIEHRTEERRVGKEGVSPCSSRWSPEH